MAKQTYQVSELDERTRQYLLDVRRTGGSGLAGIFMSAGAPASTWGFPLTGIILLGVVLYVALPPLNDPTHQAMLLTAALMMGGWLMLAGIRITIAYARGQDLGIFIYADPRQIWSVDHSVVQRWPLKNLERCSVDGGELALAYPDGVEKVPVPFEIGIIEIAVYVEYWLQVRGDGAHDQALIDEHAAAARATAYGEEPGDQADFSTDIPTPKPDEEAVGQSRDWPILLAICVFGIALFFIVHWIVLVWHDFAVFDFVRTKSPAHWRAYLLDARNTMHREKVQQMLRDRYQQKAEQLKGQILARNQPGFNGSENALPEILLALAEAPQPIVTLRIQNTTDPANMPQNQPNQFPIFDPAQLQNTAQTEITDSLYSAIGQDLISLILPPDDFTPLIEIRFKFVRGENKQNLDWSVTVRKTPDSEPHFKTEWTSEIPNNVQPNDIFNQDLRRIMTALAGNG